MLNYFSPWNALIRRQRKLQVALCQWQCNPTLPLGEYGLSLTTEIAFDSSSGDGLDVIAVLHLRHSAGGMIESGQARFGLLPTPTELAHLANVFLMWSYHAEGIVGTPPDEDIVSRLNSLVQWES